MTEDELKRIEEWAEPPMPWTLPLRIEKRDPNLPPLPVDDLRDANGEFIMNVSPKPVIMQWFMEGINDRAALVAEVRRLRALLKEIAPHLENIKTDDPYEEYYSVKMGVDEILGIISKA